MPDDPKAEVDEETQALLTADFEIGHYIKWVVQFFQYGFEIDKYPVVLDKNRFSATLKNRVSYYIQFSTNIKRYNYKIKTSFVSRCHLICGPTKLG